MLLFHKKKHLVLAFTAPWLFSVLTAPLAQAVEVPEGGRKQVFIVSAYYSPLPDQEYYLRGDYDAERRLNGNGTNGADGTPVYPGMLAAPRSYPFGTKIYLPGLGIGTVHDRGGAIKSHVGYDRIDVWMGSGDEGLKRALNWGLRRVEGIVYDDPDIPETLNVESISPTASVPAGTSLRPGARGEAVESLQEKLQELGFFSGPVTGNYGTLTQEAVFKFQQSAKLVESLESPGAGIFGPKTKIALEERMSGKESSSSLVAKESDPVVLPITSLSGKKMTKGSQGADVKRLQMILASLGYFSGEFTEHYGSQTAGAVMNFQQEYGLIADENSPGAGTLGPKTYARLAAVLTEFKAAHADFAPRETNLAIGSEQIDPKALLAEVQAEVRGTIEEQEDLLAAAEQLQPGDHNAAVKELQLKLITAGFLRDGLATGFYGEETKKAVFALQKKYELAADFSTPWAGTFGPKTRVALLTELGTS